MKYEVELNEEYARYISAHRDEYSSATVVGVALTRLADAIRANPPRMDEPGWGEKVIAHTADSEGRRTWLHFRRNRIDGTEATNQWCDGFGNLANWDDLINPEPYKADA